MSGCDMDRPTDPGTYFQAELKDKPFPHPLFKTNLTYGTVDDCANKDFQEVSFDVARSTYKEYMHAAHAMLYCKNDSILWKRYHKEANVMMQMRFDGNLGFPGGLLDKEGEDAVGGLNRELQEEMGLDLATCTLVQADHVASHVNHPKKLVTHFYVKQVTPEDYAVVERNVLQADEWGIETFGVLRVPLYAMDDGYRGLPVFLTNKFSGNAREQLLLGIRKHAIISETKLLALLDANRHLEEARRSSQQNRD